MLIPWLVFAVGAGVQFWRVTHAFRQRLNNTTAETEQFRRSLERTWQNDQPSAS
ncbi:MAG: hypothetical protein VKN17_05225 [Cyanobacteriota bacterium]|nr:hypothetical protein [Cyanobacteriota bacterium]